MFQDKLLVGQSVETFNQMAGFGDDVYTTTNYQKWDSSAKVCSASAKTPTRISHAP